MGTSSKEVFNAKRATAVSSIAEAVAYLGTSKFDDESYRSREKPRYRNAGRTRLRNTDGEKGRTKLRLREKNRRGRKYDSST